MADNIGPQENQAERSSFRNRISTRIGLRRFLRRFRRSERRKGLPAELRNRENRKRVGGSASRLRETNIPLWNHWRVGVKISWVVFTIANFIFNVGWPSLGSFIEKTKTIHRSTFFELFYRSVVRCFFIECNLLTKLQKHAFALMNIIRWKIHSVESVYEEKKTKLATKFNAESQK